jgi:hypothetical protein
VGSPQLVPEADPTFVAPRWGLARICTCSRSPAADQALMPRCSLASWRTAITLRAAWPARSRLANLVSRFPIGAWPRPWPGRSGGPASSCGSLCGPSRVADPLAAGDGRGRPRYQPARGARQFLDCGGQRDAPGNQSRSVGHSGRGLLQTSPPRRNSADRGPGTARPEAAAIALHAQSHRDLAHGTHPRACSHPQLSCRRRHLISASPARIVNGEIAGFYVTKQSRSLLPRCRCWALMWGLSAQQARRTGRSGT